MIRIMKYGEVSPDQVFARVEPKVDVEKIVADIIENVRNQGDRACMHTARNSTRRS